MREAVYYFLHHYFPLRIFPNLKSRFCNVHASKISRRIRLARYARILMYKKIYEYKRGEKMKARGICGLAALPDYRTRLSGFGLRGVF